MEIWKIIKMLERKTTIPQDGDEFCDISKAFDAAIVSLEELKQYRKIGAVQELEQISRDFKRQIEHSEKLSEVLNSTKNLLKKRENILNKYYEIGTVEECWEAKERQRSKKPMEYEDKYYGCPTCGNPLMHKWEKYPNIPNDKSNGLPYCLGCGQKLDWSDTDCATSTPE